jgi:hypothetical protein
MGNHYFNNAEVQGWIEQFLAIPVEKRDTNQKALLIREKIFGGVSKIINGIIFKHKFTVWEQYDDLFQEAAEACIKALPKFNPNFITSNGSKATAFNYFSLTAKRCLKFYTIKNKKHRNNLPMEEYGHELILEDTNDRMSLNTVWSDFIASVVKIFNSPKNKKFLPLIEILREYLDKMGNFNKRDFFRFAKSYGWSPNLIRKFLKIMKDHKDKIYKDNHAVSSNHQPYVSRSKDNSYSEVN